MIYHYDPKRYFYQVTLTGMLCIVFSVGSSIVLFQYPVLVCIIWIVSLYTINNAFIARCMPQTIEINEDVIVFSAYGKTVTYKRKELKTFRVREFPSNGKMYLRINNASLFKGRYWIQTKMYNDSKQLFRTFIDLEYKLHPNTIKARARRVNTEYLRKEKLGKE